MQDVSTQVRNEIDICATSSLVSKGFPFPGHIHLQSGLRSSKILSSPFVSLWSFCGLLTRWLLFWRCCQAWKFSERIFEFFILQDDINEAAHRLGVGILYGPDTGILFIKSNRWRWAPSKVHFVWSLASLFFKFPLRSKLWCTWPWQTQLIELLYCCLPEYKGLFSW